MEVRTGGARVAPSASAMGSDNDRRFVSLRSSPKTLLAFGGLALLAFVAGVGPSWPVAWNIDCPVNTVDAHQVSSLWECGSGGGINLCLAFLWEPAKQNTAKLQKGRCKAPQTRIQVKHMEFLETAE